jgi:hypothetical protein
MSIRSSASERVARVVLLVVAVFFAIAAAFALLIATILLFPGSALDGVWAMKAGSRAGFVALGGWGIVLMIVLAIVLIVTVVGIVQRRPWSRWVAFALLVINVVPDAVQGFAGNVAIFLPISIAAVFAVYLALPVTGRACRPRKNIPIEQN